MRLTINLLILLGFASSLSAQQVNIIPQPTEVKVGKGFLTIEQPIGFIYNDNVPKDHGASFFKDYLKKFYNISQFKTGSEHSYGLPTEIFIDYSPSNKDDSYEITVDKKGIYVSGNDKGLFYAFQTLIQLLPPSINSTASSKIQIPFVTVKDRPNFPYRGMHLDVGRHFFPVSFVKKYIDYLALHKMNYFHWHLTEDQGWRIEIKKYPKLTEVGAWRNGTIIGRYPGTGNDGIHYGGYYTQDDIKEVVKYAADRYIIVIPEIEMPGHGSAAIAAYPWLSCFPNESTKHPPQCAWSGDSTGKQVQQTWGVFDDVFCAGKDSTFKFMQDVLDEVMVLFPSKYIHVGGDECPKTNWKRCPLCQKRIKDEHLKDEHELQSYFIQRMEKYLNSKGRTLIGWDEILEGGLAPKAVVMSWRGEAGGIAAAREKHNVIMTPGGWVYFDHSQSQNEDSVTIGGYTPVEKTYSYNPIPDSLTKEQGQYILGAQGNVWTEYMGNERKVEYMIFPRMSALSEALWSKNHDWKDFEKRLPEQFRRYDLWKANYSKAYFDLKTTILPDPQNPNWINWRIIPKQKEATIIVTDPKNQTTSFVSKADSIEYTIKESGHYTAQQFLTGKKMGDPTLLTIHFNKATGKKITLAKPASQNYPGDGAFTLVNGVQNEKGLLRSKEVLGFSGDDLEAVIDLGTSQAVSNVIVHSLSSGGSWVFPPKYAEIFISADGKTFSSVGKSENFVATSNTNGTITVSFSPTTGRYIKIFVKNLGIVPEGNRGAGNKAWLLVDEIEVN
jgi:hexosaminidase